MNEDSVVYVGVDVAKAKCRSWSSPLVELAPPASLTVSCGGTTPTTNRGGAVVTRHHRRSCQIRLHKVRYAAMEHVSRKAANLPLLLQPHAWTLASRTASADPSYTNPGATKWGHLRLHRALLEIVTAPRNDGLHTARRRPRLRQPKTAPPLNASPIKGCELL
jgi:hypothetical protein